jgi:hypothetical protein
MVSQQTWAKIGKYGTITLGLGAFILVENYIVCNCGYDEGRMRNETANQVYDQCVTANTVGDETIIRGRNGTPCDGLEVKLTAYQDRDELRRITTRYRNYKTRMTQNSAVAQEKVNNRWQQVR